MNTQNDLYAPLDPTPVLPNASGRPPASPVVAIPNPREATSDSVKTRPPAVAEPPEIAGPAVPQRKDSTASCQQNDTVRILHPPRGSSPSGSTETGKPMDTAKRSGVDGPVLGLLRCPRCSAGLKITDKSYNCDSPACGFEYPLTGNVPILVDPNKSVFDLGTFKRQDPTFFRPVAAWRQTLSDMIPDMSRNVAADRVYARLRSLLVAANPVSNVLVVGGGVTGSGMESLLHDSRIRLIETDAAVAERTQLICDAHDLPFADASMDAVVVQAVLEHVVDPVRCVAEIHRVLKPGGLVYSDTPFMQQVHGRQFDFTRFTRLGHRRLFRRFDEVESGITCGPGMALAWSLRYFLMSFWDNETYRAVASGFSRIAFWWLSMLDPCLVTRKAANDAASAFFFLGKKGDSCLDDRDLLASYIGGQ